MRWQPWRIALLIGLALTVRVYADDPLRREVRLASGRVVDFTVHYDRNALRQSVRVGEKLIALTSAGTLLLFELPEVRLVRERIDRGCVKCVGRGEGDTILAGLEGGRICRVDPVTLELTDVAKVSEEPAWVGWDRARGGRKAGLIVVTRPTKKIGEGEESYEVAFTRVHDLSTDKVFTLEDYATHFLLDREGRLWLGVDHGEWGGKATKISLSEGTMTPIPSPRSRHLKNLGERVPWDGIYGFTELRNGQVWAYGGMEHGSTLSGFIARVDQDEPHVLLDGYRPHWYFGLTSGKRNPDRPELPITHVVEEENGLLVFSYGDVFRTNRNLTSSKKVASLDLEYVNGRPDAMGSYPAVQAVHAPEPVGSPLIVATLLNGYFLFDGAKVTPRRLPGQLSAASVDRIYASAEGILALDDDLTWRSSFFDEFPATHRWRLAAKGWEVDPFAPPYELDPLDEARTHPQVRVVDDDTNPQVEEVDEVATSWIDTQVLVGPAGAIYTVSSNDGDPGTRTTARWVDGKSIRLGREVSSLNVAASFITADGTLWNATSGELRRFDNGRWETVATVEPRVNREQDDPKPFGQDAAAERLGGHSDLVPVNSDRAPWILRDRIAESLWRLTPGAAGKAPELSQLDVGPLYVNAAIPWSNGLLLLATDQGMRTYDASAGKLARVALPDPQQPLHALATDRLGRLWIGGEKGLGMVNEDGKTLESFDLVPWLGGSEVSDIALDPDHDDGVIVALGTRGVIFVRAKIR